MASEQNRDARWVVVIGVILHKTDPALAADAMAKIRSMLEMH